MATIEGFVGANAKPLITILLGLLLLGTGVLLSQKTTGGDEIVSNPTSRPRLEDSIVVAVEGAVQAPGVYTFAAGDRISTALEKAGGYTEAADTEWAARTINKAAKLTDGMKLYIKSTNEQSGDESASKDSGVYGVSNEGMSQEAGSLSVNTASQKELETLDGIGQSYAQKIIDHRPYSAIEELVTKGALTQKLLDKNRQRLIL